jgi:hypothetical protein
LAIVGEVIWQKNRVLFVGQPFTRVNLKVYQTMHYPIQLTVMYVKGSGCGLSRGTILAFGWRDREELRKTSVMIASVPAKIGRGNLSNTSQK